MTDPAHLLESSPLAGALLALRIFAAGAAWLWLWPEALAAPAERWRRMVCAGGLAAATGLVGLLLPLTLLSSWGWMAPWTINAVSIAVPVTGTFFALVFRSPELLSRARAALPAAAAAMALFTVALLLSNRGENIAGGQDPGVYSAQGMHLLATGGKAQPDPLMARLTPAERPDFVDDLHGYTALFPAVPLRGGSVNGPGYFFPLTPVWIAVCGHDAGLRGAMRSAHFTAILSLLLMAGLVAANRGSAAFALSACALLASQPVWIYHWNVPTSEMLDLCLMLSIGLVLDHRTASPAASGLLGLLFLAAVLNRLAFLPFGGCLMALCAWRDLGDPARGRVLFSRLAQAAGLAAGAGHDWFHHAEAIVRLGGTPAVLWQLCAALGVLALALDAGARPFAPLRRVGVRIIGALILLSIGAYLLDRPPSRLIFRISVAGNFAFIGHAAALPALAGAAVFCLRPARLPGSLPSFALFLFAAMMALLSRSEITAQFPYATRRALSYATPLVALLGGLAVAAAWDRLRGRGRGLAAAALLAVLALQAPKAGRAWTTAPYAGLGEALGRIAREIGPDDVVLCDHFTWATPLRMIFQRPAYCPSEQWIRDPAACGRVMAAAQRLRREGVRVLLLTSTEKGPSVFPLSPPLAPGRVSGFAQTNRVVVQSMNIRDFATRPRVKEFALYSLEAEP